MKALAILGVKNEGAFLMEWLAHHRAVGFTDFLVYSNDCSDGTDAMLDRLQAMGWLVHLPNPGPHEKGAHFGALQLAERLNARAPNALASLKELMNEAADNTLPQQLGRERHHFLKNLNHANAGIGIDALLARQKPQFE